VKSLKTYVILLLALTTLGGAALAWRQYGELVELRAAAMNRSERSDLQRRLWDLEKANRDLQAQLAARRDMGDSDEALAGNPDDAASARDRGGRGGERGPDSRGRGPTSGIQQANAIRELMNKPEVQAMINLQQKAAIEARYATLFKNLNLTPDQAERMKTLLSERATTMQDVMMAAREQGISPRDNPESFRKLVADAQNDINSGIKSVIGEQGFDQLTTYEQTLPQRNLVNELQQRLSYTSTPLTATQAEQMVQILAANSAQRSPASSNTGPNTDSGRGQPGGGRGGPPVDFGLRGGDLGGIIAGVIGGGPNPGGGMDMGRGGGTVPVTSGAITQAQSVLAPPQVAALQQIQQQQQTQQQLRQLVNETLSANQPTSTKGAPAPRPRG
jgi:hypothetical protein